MVKKAADRKQLELVNAQQGQGTVYPLVVLEGDEFTGAGRLFNVITFPPKTSIGYHQHVGETETYLILSGDGMYNDNGTLVPVQAGDVTYCANGESHSIENTGDGDLVIVAVILFDKTKA